jgi:membrane-associated protein
LRGPTRDNNRSPVAGTDEMVHLLIDFLHTLTDPERLIHLLGTVLTGWLGYAALFAVVFSETGLLLGFFLPGDSLLFTVGVVAGAGQLNIALIVVLLSIAAVVGDGVGYLLGRRAGRSVFQRPDSRLFKREHLIRTQEFYDKHGGKTIIIARFVPIIRTFAPFVAGVAEMNYPKFLSYNVFGGVGWVTAVSLAGYSLGSVPLVRRNFDKAVLLIVFLSVVPIIVEYLKVRHGKKGRTPAPLPESE